jgi:hypothetical protein
MILGGGSGSCGSSGHNHSKVRCVPMFAITNHSVCNFIFVCATSIHCYSGELYSNCCINIFASNSNGYVLMLLRKNAK